MRMKLKKVYYCDFCKKKSLKSLAKHEQYCTANPKRECRLCGTKDITPLIAKYRGTYKIVEENVKWKDEKITIEEIEADVNNCPNCTLTILRCAFDIPARYEFNYDYKRAWKNWWEEHGKKEGSRW